VEELLMVVMDHQVDVAEADQAAVAVQEITVEVTTVVAAQVMVVTVVVVMAVQAHHVVGLHQCHVKK